MISKKQKSKLRVWYLSKIGELKLLRKMKPFRASHADHIVISKLLGRGGEGVVYLGKDRHTGERIIIKYFITPIEGSPSRSLRLYAKTVEENNNGLPKIALIESNGKIIGVKYKYKHLHNIHWRLFKHFDDIAIKLISDYSRMQSYLIANSRLVITDAALSNFMMAGDGSFHFIDFGYGIKRIDHPKCSEFGQIGYGFFMLLFEIYHKNIKNNLAITSGYSYEQPCRYSFYEGVDELAEQHAWVKDIIREIRNNNASIFLDATFYQRITTALDQYIRYPRVKILMSYALYFAANVKSHLR